MIFGKYKGTSVKEILTFDLQYILWCIDNIDNLMQRLDDADKQMLKYLLKPLEGIKSKKSRGYFVGTGRKRHTLDI